MADDELDPGRPIIPGTPVLEPLEPADEPLEHPDGFDPTEETGS